jgi:hypothetical protein
VDGSAKYVTLDSFGKAVVNGVVKVGCSFLTSSGPRLAPAQKQAFINAYDRAAQALVGPGWLNQTQATTLKGLAASL